MQCNVNVLRFKEICVCKLKLAYGTGTDHSTGAPEFSVGFIFLNICLSMYINCFIDASLQK